MEHHTTTRVCNVKDESSVKAGEQEMLYLFAKLRAAGVLCSVLPALFFLSAPLSALAPTEEGGGPGERE
jgi:hypothetical protein